jgi:hypothetical protein
VGSSGNSSLVGGVREGNLPTRKPVRQTPAAMPIPQQAF